MVGGVLEHKVDRTHTHGPASLLRSRPRHGRRDEIEESR